MTKNEAIDLAQRSEHWLRNHSCAWCNQTLLRALMHGCGAIYERCDPTTKKFSDDYSFNALNK